MMSELRVLELYSGIGGMHFALQDAFPSESYSVVASVDVNDSVNNVYKHNFPATNNLNNAIEGFSVETLKKLHFNAVLMSPPCQPFTRLGLKEDINDPRTRSFLHFVSLLPKLSNQIEYILLENVKGFEDSKAHEMLCTTLSNNSFYYQGFLLSPRHLGIPNSRLRYFLIARKTAFTSNTHNLYPIISSQSDIDTKENEIENSKCLPIKKFLEVHSDDEKTFQKYKVAEDVVEKYLPAMDIVNEDSVCSTCFTKSYGQYVKATGSLLDVSNTENKTCNSHYNKLRYFTPNEVANLMCFPKHFSFPNSITRKQKYRMLGNSLNVKVVSFLLGILFE